MKKIKTFIILLAPYIVFAQNVDTLIKSDFSDPVKLSNTNSNTNKSSSKDPEGKLFDKRDIFNFNKVNTSEVNGFNGKANIIIPIHEIKQGGLTIPIQLSYNSGGIKVDQFATEVGLGWSLEAGPVINKEIIGIPDYKSLWFKSQSGLQEYQHGYLKQPSVIIDSPDMYNIFVGGTNASFYIDKSFNPNLISPFNGIKVSIVQGNFDEQFVKKYGFYTNYSGVSGVCPSRPISPTYLLGYFSDHFCENIFQTYKETKSIDVVLDRYTYSFRDANYSLPVTTMTLPKTCPPDGSPCWENFSKNVDRFINKYNITDIKDNFTQRKVSFQYNEWAGTNSYVRHSKVFNMIKDGVNGDYIIPSEIVDGYKKDYDSYIRKNISKIVTDSEIIEFVYTNNREDSKSLDIVLNSPTNFTTYYQDPLLSKIYIKDKNNTVIYTYSFNYGYFNSQCTNQNLHRNSEQCKRLKLLSVVKSKYDTSIEKEEYKLEYYEDTNLPQIGSYRQDPFGYKSLLSDSETSEFDAIYQTILPKKPKMFSYNDNINNSTDKLKYVSTVKIASLNPVSDNGYEQTLSDLANSRAWSLKSIEYPTKGKQIFNYELNSFSWKGNNINGGGIRISRIDISDNNSNYSTNYYYENGKVISLPTYNGHSQVSNVSGYLESRPQDYYPILYPIKGGVISYDKVSTQINNKGKTIKEFSSISDFPLKIDAIHIPTNITINLYPYYYGKGNLKFNYLLKEDLIGNIKNEYIYDKDDKLLKETNITYSNQESSFSSAYPLIQNLSIYPVFDPSTEYNFYPIGYPGGFNLSPKFNYLPEAYKKTRNNIITKKTTDYFVNGNVVSTENYTYLDSCNSIKNITRVSPAETFSEEYLYPFEAGLQYNSLMANKDEYKFTKVGHISKKNSNFVRGDLYLFNTFNTNQFLIAETKSILSNDDLVSEQKYDKYDSKGNLQQYTTKDGIPTAIVWGYNQTQPIAKIVGATYAQVSSLAAAIISASDLDASNPSTEPALITALDNFRKDSTMVNYQISTYTYDPLIGVTSITPPSGIREVYLYDTANRLKEIRENSATGKLLKEFKYNYKN